VHDLLFMLRSGERGRILKATAIVSERRRSEVSAFAKPLTDSSQKAKPKRGGSGSSANIGSRSTNPVAEVNWSGSQQGNRVVLAADILAGLPERHESSMLEQVGRTSPSKPSRTRMPGLKFRVRQSTVAMSAFLQQGKIPDGDSSIFAGRGKFIVGGNCQ
jgi:hypothetical protein